MHGHRVDLQRYRAFSEERKFIERIKTLIFLQAVLAIEIMEDPQSNLEEKVNPSVFLERVESIIISIGSNITNNIIRNVINLYIVVKV